MKKYILMSLAAIALLVSSCQKTYLDTFPTEQTPSKAVWESLDAYEAALSGTYYRLSMLRYDQGHVGMNAIKIYSDYTTGIISRQKESTGWFWSMYDFTDWNSNTGSGFTYTWRYCYLIIKNANNLIENAEKVPAAASDEKARVANVVAQAKGLRAFMYHTLNTLYATRWEKGGANAQLSVPIVLTEEESLKQNERVAASVVMAQVESDLNESIALFEANKVAHKSSQFNLTFAYALKARIHMYKQEYTEALAAAKTVLAKNSNIMGVDAYYGGFNDATNPEWIFGGKITSTDVLAFGSWFAQFGANFSSTFIRNCGMAMDTRYLDQIPNTDLRKVTADGKMGIFLTDNTETIKKNGAKHYFDLGFIPTSGSAVYTAYSRKYLQTTPGTTTGAGDVIYCRVAEVLYIAAEAALLQDAPDAPAAKKYLEDAVKPYDAAFVAPATKDELLAKITLYKIFDQWGEGRSYEDFKRRGTEVDRSGSNHSIIALVYKYGPMPGQPRNDIWKFKITRSITNNNPNIQTSDQ